MFNNYSISNNNIVSNHVNAVTGNITKTYSKSFFLRFNLKSRIASELFAPIPRLYCKRNRGDYERNEDVIIIQMVVAGDMEVIAEIMFKDEYEEVVR